MLLRHRPVALSAAREVRAGDLTHQAPSASSQHPVPSGASQWDPIPSEGALGPRSTNGSCVLAARTLLSCLAPSFQALGKLQLCNARARALRNCLHRCRGTSSNKAMSVAKTPLKKHLHARDTTPSAGFGADPLRGRGFLCRLTAESCPYRVPVQEDVPDVLPQDPGILGGCLLANVRA